MKWSSGMAVCWLALLSRLLVGCAAAPTGIPTALPPVSGAAPTSVAITPTTEPATTTSLVAGKISFAGAPLPGARAELRAPDWQVNPSPAIASAVANATGQYALENPPGGDYSLVGVFPDGQVDAAGYRPINLTAGQVITAADITLEKALALLEPPAGAEVSAPVTLGWEGLPEAARYQLIVSDAGTTELIASQGVTETTVVLMASLTPGRSYDWTITALTEDEIAVGSLSSQFALAGGTEETVAPTVVSTLDTLPPSCRTRRPNIAIYVDVERRYCFLYPIRFSEGEVGPNLPGVIGPPLDESGEPVFASLVVEVAEVAPGTDLQSVLDSFLQEFVTIPGWKVNRQPTLVNGEPAEILEPIPGRLSSRDVIVLHGTQRYRLIFHPSPEDAPQAREDVEALFQEVLGSFTILQ
jgi:hypothetical protein